MATESGKRDTVLAGPFAGHFGQWYLTRADVSDVELYRGGMAVAAGAAAVAAAALALGYRGDAGHASLYDVLLLVGLGGFGVALHKIHIDPASLHRLLKFAYVGGIAGALATTSIAHASGGTVGALAVAETAARYPPSLLFGVGWIFVALTGVFFKEAFCFGRLEAVGLTLLTPLLFGGHCAGALPHGAEVALSVLLAAQFVWFAVSKQRQNVMDDLGDKSVFEHMAGRA